MSGPTVVKVFYIILTSLDLAYYKIPYLSGYKTGFPFSRMTTNTKSALRNFAIIRVLPFLNNPKYLDPSYKMDLDIWDCFGRKKLHLITKEIRYFWVQFAFCGQRGISKR